MLPAFVALTVLFTMADHWTTYLCLRAPIDSWQVTEANPIAEWLFGSVGLVPGLLIDSVITLIAIVFLLTTSLIPPRMKTTFFLFVAIWTGWAVSNNLGALRSLGLSPWGLA
jgi:hypothetical protein